MIRVHKRNREKIAPLHTIHSYFNVVKERSIHKVHGRLMVVTCGLRQGVGLWAAGAGNELSANQCFQQLFQKHVQIFGSLL